MSQRDILPEIEHIEKSLSAPSDPSEVHGMLCGMLCTDQNLAAERWLSQVNQETAEVNLNGQPALYRLYEITADQLNDADLSFHLLLPDDNQALVNRTRALSRWCQGFLFGLGLGINADRGLPTEIQEFISDLTKITQVTFLDTGEASERDESDYAEIVEYIRVGVMLANQELQAQAAPPSPRLH